VTIDLHAWSAWCGTALAAAALSYAVIALVAVRLRLKPQPSTLPAATPPVTVLKPLCGDEHGLYECLRSFCDQVYPHFQIVFGVSNGADPAVDVVARLQREFPHVDLQLVVDRRQHGSNRKVSNLINMMAVAQHEYLVISDSDVRVQPDYLARVVRPLLNSEVGIVTCPYRGNPREGFWSLLGALFINDWLMPSVRISAMSGSRAFAFGATIGIRRSVLSSIGGFPAIADQLADDYRLGELTRRAGLATVLSDVVVETCVDERSFGDLVRHELRWLRTIRAVRPTGYTLWFMSFGVPMAALGALLAGGSRPTLLLFALTALSRLVLHWAVRTPRETPARFLAVPLSDAVCVVLWMLGFVTRRVHWRDDLYRVARDGTAVRCEDLNNANIRLRWRRRAPPVVARGVSRPDLRRYRLRAGEERIELLAVTVDGRTHFVFTPRSRWSAIQRASRQRSRVWRVRSVLVKAKFPILLCVILFTPVASAYAAASDPAAMQVQTLNASLLKSMRAGAAESTNERYRSLEPVIEQVFALPLVTRLSVGPQWTSFSPDQQTELINAFTRYTVANYAHNFRDFDGQKFDIEDNVSSRGTDKIVHTRIVPAHDTPVTLLYRMQEVDGTWKIVDVISDGVSQLALRRTDFAAAIAAGGAPTLIAHLHKVSDDLLK
jgi:ceramide glucosyltransferase